MPKTRRVIRKTRPPRAALLDDQLWPLVVALVILGGFLAGTILAYLRTNDPRWYANAWTWLIAIPLVIAGMLVWLGLTGNRYLRRTMQLAVILCAILHVVLFIVAVETDVFHRIWREVVASADRLQPKEEVTVPEYHSWQHDPEKRAKSDLERPVETRVPDPEVEVKPPPQPPEKPTVDQRETRPVPDPQPEVPPNVMKRQQPNRSIPRQRQDQSRLSRTAQPVPPHPTQDLPVPDMPPQAPRRPQAIEAQTTGVRPQTPERADPRQPTRQTPRMSEGPREPRLARKSAQRAPNPASPTVAALARRLERPRVVPPSDVNAVHPPDAARQTQPDAPEPKITAARKQQTRSPKTRDLLDQPTTRETAELSPKPRSRRQAAERQPTLARTRERVANQQTRATTHPELSTTADQAAAGAVAERESSPVRPSATSRLEKQVAAHTNREPVRPPKAPAARPKVATAANTPRRTDTAAMPITNASTNVSPERKSMRARPLTAAAQRVSRPASSATSRRPPAGAAAGLAATPTPTARQRANSNQTVERRPSPAEAKGAAAVAQVAPLNRRPTESMVPPSLASQAAPDRPTRRTMREAPSAQSRVAVDRPSPSAATAANSTRPPSPARLALNKSRAGVAGSGRSPNLGRATAAAEGPAPVASGAAQRARTTQNAPPGPALTPHAAALVRSGRAGKLEPSATLRATPQSVSTLRGSHAPADADASSSAALTQAASNAVTGELTATKGTLDVDTGPTTLVSQGGAGRASGGGQPDRAPGTDTGRLARSATGRIAEPSLAVAATAPAAAAPRQAGNGPLATTDMAASPNAIVNSQTGQPAPAPGGPVAVVRDDVSASSGSPIGDRRTDEPRNMPALASTGKEAGHVTRQSSKNRQIPVETGVADIVAGSAIQTDDQQSSAQRMMASMDVGAPRKQLASGAAEGKAPADLAAATGAVGERVQREVPARRGEAVDAATGLPQPGGGHQSLARTARGPQLVANVRAESVSVAGTPQSSGRPNVEPSNSTGAQATRLAGGAAPARNLEPSGADAAAVLASAGNATQPGIDVTFQQRSPSDLAGPVVRDTANHGGPGKRASRMTLPATGRTISLDNVPPGNLIADPIGKENALAAAQPQIGPLSRSAGAPLPVKIHAAEGPGGLGQLATVDVGLSSRRARPDKVNVQLETTRFTRRELGGLPNFNATAAVTAEPFRRRTQRAGGMGPQAEGPGPQTEEAIELGLAFLSRAQSPDGNWTLDRFAAQDGLPQLASDTAATGLALLAFQGAGYHHMDYRYADVVHKGIDYLVENQQANGSLFVPMDGESNRVVRFYSHGIAALALSEAYGMTQDPQLREPAQRALNYIVDTQNIERGGWRYTPQFSSDTSVTGWMMMALKSGELANLKVPANTYAKIGQWLDAAQASKSQPYLYCYNPYAPDTESQGGGRVPTKTMTSVGLLMRLYSGWRRDNPFMARGADYLLQHPPAIGTPTNPQRDTYYWYYATQVMYHMGGQYWEAWNGRLHPLLVDRQISDGEMAGSWDPRSPVPDRWAPFAGRLYVTTMNLLSLEVYYRHLPLYEDTLK